MMALYFVPLHHADVEEAGIFAVHGVVHEAALAVAVILRRLHQRDIGIAEQRHQVLEPVRLHDIVGVDDADHLGVGRGVHHGEPQRAGLEALQIVGIDELEALAERAAVLLDRQPERRIGRVVDHHHAFEIRIVEPRHRVERLLEHLRRLVVRRNMDRNFRRRRLGRERRGVDQPQRLAAEGDHGELVDARQRDDDQRDQQQDAQAEREGGAGHEIMSVPIGEHGGEPGAHHIGGGGQRDRLPQRHRAHRQERQRQQHAHQQGDAGELPVIGIADRAGPVEFRLARGVEQAPIGTDAAFEDLPRLVDRFDDVVVDAIGLGARDEVAQHDGLLDAAGIGVLEIVARARPAELGDDDALAGIGLAQLVVDQDRLIDAWLVGEAFPIGQDVRGDEVDRRDQLGMLDPDVPDFAGGDRHVGRALDPLDHRDQVGDLLLAAVDGFVADDDAVDVAVALGEIDHRADFALVAVLVLVDPGADRDAQAEFGGDAGHQFDAAGGRIGADGAGQRRQQLEVGADLRGLRLRAGIRMGGAAKRRVGNAGELAFEVGSAQVILRESPQSGLHARHEGDHGSDGAHKLTTKWGGISDP